jgi:hypothetical protein
MTNKIALFLGSVIVVAVLLDIIFNGGASLLFLARKFADFLEWIAFWR